MELHQSDQSELVDILSSGTARSAVTLAALFGAPWKIQILSLEVGSGEHFRAILAQDPREYLCVRFSSPGERYLVMFSEECGKAMLNACPPAYRSARRPHPWMDQSTLEEIANVVVNGLAGELADRQGMIRIISAPATKRCPKANVYEEALAGLRLADSTLVNVMIRITSPDPAAECTVILCLDALNANFLLNTVPDAFHFPY